MNVSITSTEKGTKVKPTEHTPKTPPAATGLFALLAGLLRVKGSGAPVRTLGLTVLVSLCALSFASAPAFAANGHVFSSSFTGENTHTLSDPTGIAISNTTGNVYVVDKTNNRVEEFNPTGTKLEAEFKGSGTAGELSEPEAIAIDNSGRTSAEDPSVGDVYVTDHSVVDKFEADGTYVGQITEAEGTAFAPLAGVAVDPQGVVWVYQGLGQEHPHIDAFSDARANAFLSSRESVAGEAYPGLAVDSEDDLYVAHARELPYVHIAKLNSSGEVLKAPPSRPGNYFSILGGEEQKTGVAVEASSNNVYIDSEPTESGEPAEIEEFAPSGTKIETFGAEQLTGNVGTALAVSYANVSSGDVYVLDPSAGKIDIFAPPKAAAYVESFHFGSKGSGAGEFDEPLGIAVNNATEDLYVVDKANKRVEEFNSTGTKLEAEFAPPGGFNDPEAIAVDNSVPADISIGDVYVTDQVPGGADLDKFSSTGTYLGQLRRCPEGEHANGEKCEAVGHPTSGFDESLTGGVAVGPEGNVWVGSSYGYEALVKFSDEGTFETYLKTTLAVVSLALGADENGEEVGYFAGRSAGSNGEVEDFKFDFSSGTSLSEGFSRPGTSALALDPATGDLFVDKESSIEKYAPVEAPKPSPLESFPGTGGLQGSRGIAVSPAGTVYATERTAGDVKAFAEFPLPQVAVGAVANLRPTSVTLQGSVNPEGAEVSSCEFEYGATTSYGQIVPCEQGLGEGPGELGKGTSPVLVSAKLGGLPSGTTYHYRLLASNHVGTNRGSDHVVITPGPRIAEEQVTYAEATAATLQATIDPDGSQTSYRFEYDTSPYTSSAAHGTSVPVPNTSLGSGTSAVPVSVRVTGLEAGTVYYYRAVAAGEPLGAPEVFYGPGKTFTTNPAPGSTSAETCPNAKLRAEQPYGLTLPDCRAYEMVSPLDTGGEDATYATLPALANAYGLRASLSGEAIAYASTGSFAEPTGAAVISELLSRRAGGGWSTHAITPLQEPHGTEQASSYSASVFTPELTAGVAATTARLTSEAPEIVPSRENAVAQLYVADFSEPISEQSYRYVGASPSPLGASSDLSHVVFGVGYASEWVNGSVIPVGVANNGEIVPAGVGSVAYDLPAVEEVDAWRAVSSDGSRVYFTSPAFEHASKQEPPAELYLRLHADQPQSGVAHLEANVTGTLSAGSNVIATVAPVHAAESYADLEAGSTEVALHPIVTNVSPFPFAVGQPFSGPGIPEGDTIAGVSGETLTLSAPAETKETEVLVESTRADAFAVGEQVSGYGLPPDATVTGVGTGTVTLSAPADVSATDVAVSGGGECTEATRGCTLEVSASQRSTSDTHGLQAARFWGASVDGSKVFFTSNQELTDDANTGPADNAADLYEWDLNRPEGERLKDLTVDPADPDGAAVQGVVQVSEDGSYVYFVATGVLTGAEENGEHEHAVAGKDNLYVSHEGGKPVFVTVLAPQDASDWQAQGQEGGPATHTAVVDSSGARLAFVSERSLTGYDNEQAAAGECEHSGSGFAETGACREVYVYDAQAATLACASCNPTGARPVGPSNLGLTPAFLSSYRPRNFSESGTLFFDSSDALAPHAKDGRQNVYEFENGHVYPLSNVAGDNESVFLDAGANGKDVFFASSDKLLPEDVNQNVVVWDARVEGGYPLAVSPPPCTTAESCRTASPPTPAVFGAPPSATFSGPGNIAPPPPAVVKPKSKPLTKAQKLADALKSCKKDKKKAKRQSCEKQARAKYGPTKKKAKAKKSSNDRRTKS